MKCEDARLQIGADPAGTTAELDAHVSGCPDCAGYLREMRRLEGDLRRALDWPRGETVGGGLPARDVPAANPPAANPPAASGVVVPLRAAGGTPRRPPGAPTSPAVAEPEAPGRAAPQTRASAEGAPVPAARRWAFAAGVLLVGVLAASFLALQPRDALAAQLVAHMSEEPEAWQAQRPVPQSALDLVLRRSGVRLDRVAAGEVVYAHSCFLRGRQVPHLVVATPQGPATVLVLRGERVRRRQAFDEGGYRGVLLPVPGGGGGIAVLVRDDAATGRPGAGAGTDADAGRAGAGGAIDVEAVAGRVLAAIAWDVTPAQGD